MGATGLVYEVAREFGLKLIQTRPALVPLLLGGAEKSWTEMAGVSADVTVQAARGPKFREKLLVTHRGLSGPAVLQASSYWRSGETIHVDFAPDVNGRSSLLASLLERGARRDAIAFKEALRDVLPQRLAAHLAEAGAPQGWSNPTLEAAERRFRRWEFQPAGTEGFEKAEVTAGGVDTDGLNSKTMEARTMPGLYFIGEGVDVTGHLGGFNFQWAWASAMAAASSL
jgi:predicted Rossmann fold flavoprotein